MELPAAGVRALSLRDRALREFAPLFAPGFDAAPAGVTVPASMPLAIAGSFAELIALQVRQGAAAQLPLLLPDLLYCALAPFIGPGAAAEVVAGELRLAGAARLTRRERGRRLHRARDAGTSLSMALAAKVTLALLLLASVAIAYLGPPPPWRVGLGVRSALLSAGMGGYLAAVAALAAGAIVPGALALALAGELVCAAGWLSRGEAPPSDDDSDDGGGGGGGRRPKPPPSDWDAFERAFRRYERERERQRV